MATMDLSKLPAALPASVRRVKEDGYPTKQVLDVEHDTRAWFKDTTTALQAQAVAIEKNGVKKTEFGEMWEVELDAAYISGSVVSTASLRQTLEVYATETEAGAIARTELTAAYTVGLPNGVKIVSTSNLTSTLSTYATTNYAETYVKNALSAAVTSTGFNGVSLVSTANLDQTLGAYATDSEAKTYVLTEMSVALNGGTNILGTYSAPYLQGKLTVGQLANISAVDGIKLQYSVLGYIGGTFGGFVFTGTQKMDGSPPSYVTEFFSDVYIWGDLVVAGTLDETELAANSATQTTVGVGYSGLASANVQSRGGLIKIEVVYLGQTSDNVLGPNAYPGLPSASTVGALSIKRNGTTLLSTPNNTDTKWYYSGLTAPSGGGGVSGTTYTYWRNLQTTLVWLDSPGSGFVAYEGFCSIGGTVVITVTEHLR